MGITTLTGEKDNKGRPIPYLDTEDK